MKVLATIGAGRHHSLLELSGPTFASYAARHGYEFVVADGSEARGRELAWAKVPLLRRLLADADLVLWLDADAMILDESVDIADVPDPACFQAIVRDGLGPNTGVWLLRQEERALRFLDAVWNVDLPPDEMNWWDNSAVLHLLGYTTAGWPPTQTRQTEWLDGTYWLPEEWNRITTWASWRGARIHHVAGERHALRLTQMRADKHYLAGNRVRARMFRLPWNAARLLRASQTYANLKSIYRTSRLRPGNR